MNQAVLIGNLVANPELRKTQNDISVCNFSIGVSRRFADQNGDRETDFFKIVVWRGQADNCAQYLKKGSLVAVKGEIQNRSWVDDNGVKKYITEIVAEEVQFLKTPNNEASAEDAQDLPM